MTPWPTPPRAHGRASRSLCHLLSKDHYAVVLILVAFFAAAAAYFWLVGRWGWWQLRWSYPAFLGLALLGSAARILAALFSREGLGDILSARSVLGAFLVFALACPFQSTFNSIKQTLGDVRGFSWDPALSRADAWLHGGRLPWEWLAPLVDSAAVVRWVDRLYMTWFPLLVAFVVWAAWTRDRDLRQRVLVSALLTWIVCGVGLALLFPSAGPCYYGRVTGSTDDPYGPLMTILGQHDRGASLFASFNQQGLWAASQQAIWLPFGGISAMPSMHVGMAVLLALVAGRRAWPLGMVGWAYAAAIQVGSIVLGWHYALDGYVAGVVTSAIWLASARYFSRDLAAAPEIDSSHVPIDSNVEPA